MQFYAKKCKHSRATGSTAAQQVAQQSVHDRAGAGGARERHLPRHLFPFGSLFIEGYYVDRHYIQIEVIRLVSPRQDCSLTTQPHHAYIKQHIPPTREQYVSKWCGTVVVCQRGCVSSVVVRCVSSVVRQGGMRMQCGDMGCVLSVVC